MKTENCVWKRWVWHCGEEMTVCREAEADMLYQLVQHWMRVSGGSRCSTLPESKRRTSLSCAPD